MNSKNDSVMRLLEKAAPGYGCSFSAKGGTRTLGALYDTAAWRWNLNPSKTLHKSHISKKALRDSENIQALLQIQPFSSGSNLVAMLEVSIHKSPAIHKTRS